MAANVCEQPSVNRREESPVVGRLREVPRVDLLLHRKEVRRELDELLR